MGRFKSFKAKKKIYIIMLFVPLLNSLFFSPFQRPVYKSYTWGGSRQVKGRCTIILTSRSTSSRGWGICISSTTIMFTSFYRSRVPISLETSYAITQISIIQQLRTEPLLKALLIPCYLTISQCIWCHYRLVL